MDLPYLSADDVARHLTPIVAIDALQAALVAGFDPETDPPRRFVGLERGDLIMMPSELGGHLAVKLVTIGGDPRVQGVVVVFSSETLAPVALIDGIALTNVRTSAVSALAVRHLAREDAERLLIFGRGPQAHAHAEAIRAIRPISHVDLVGREAGGAPELVAAADVICCCTTASTPLFDGSLVRDGAVVVAIGTHDADARETDDALAARATVVVESRTSALREAGDVICAIESGALASDALVTLSELARGAATIGSGPRLFKSSGMSWEDAVMAGAVVRTAG
jgi:ornithine cyclodeaminase/alanine dehydrogenase-like protein (mu-crystallin family)